MDRPMVRLLDCFFERIRTVWWYFSNNRTQVILVFPILGSLQIYHERKVKNQSNAFGTVVSLPIRLRLNSFFQNRNSCLNRIYVAAESALLHKYGQCVTMSVLDELLRVHALHVYYCYLSIGWERRLSKIQILIL